MSAIEFINVGKRWGDVVALHGIDLQVAAGSFCVLLGPSGCGKSTTLRILAGLEAPTSGQVLINGRDVTALPPAERGIAMVFQNYALFPHLSVADNICFGLQVRKLPAPEQAKRLHEAAELLGLSALLARKPATLSGGQQQRVALGRALVARASVCLMDEPLSNLDAQLRQEMRLELRELQQRLKLTVVYVTHDQTEAMAMADQVVLLNAGRVEQAAAPRTLYSAPASTFVAKFIGTPAMNLLSLEAGVVHGSDLKVTAGGAMARTLGVRPEAIALAAHRLPPEGFSSLSATVHSLEYLGADLVLRCAVGTGPQAQTITVRADGHCAAAVGHSVQLQWPESANHWFDAQGRRL